MERIARQMTATTTSQEYDVLTKPFLVSVNNKPVEVEEPLVTGLEIKEASIEQGVAIQLDFSVGRGRSRRQAADRRRLRQG